MTSHEKEELVETPSRIVSKIERGVFAIRWILILPYLGLLAAMGMYVAHMLHEVVEMAINYHKNLTANNVLLLFGLELLDMTLIAQLFVMTIQGGYAIFIADLDNAGFDLPQWIKHGLSTSDQKIKFGMSIINIMLVQMLDMFIQMLTMKPEELTMMEQHLLPMRVELFGCAVVGTISFCVINILMHPQMLRASPKHEDHK